MPIPEPRLMHVKKTSIVEIQSRWGRRPITLDEEPYYIQCNKHGDVNWDKNSVYTVEELIERNNVIIYKSKKYARKQKTHQEKARANTKSKYFRREGEKSGDVNGTERTEPDSTG